MPMLITEFGCGHDIRTGTQIILWMVLILCFGGLQLINMYYYEVKKSKLTESPLTLIILDLVLGIYTSLSGLYGVYKRKRIFVKQFFIYLGCQFFFGAITVWIYYIYIYPGQPPNPKKTRFVILTTIWAAIFLTGFLAYALAVVYSYYNEIGNTSDDDRQFLFASEENRNILPISNENNFPSNVSDISSVTTHRTYQTTAPNPNEKRRYTNAFAPTPIVEETQKVDESTSNGLSFDFRVEKDV